MSLQGDLSTLDLTGLFQNLESARKNGVLSIVDGRHGTHLCFRAGQLTAVAYPDRPPVVEFLAAAGIVDLAAIEAARKKKRRRSLCELLVESEVATREELVSWITARIVDEACELLMTRAGRFEFHEGEAPEGMFDPDERELGIALAASPLLLEAARRSDHWKLIRERIPSDSIHYEMARQPKDSASPEKAELAARVIELLDGTRSVGELVAFFPHRRFEVYELLSEWAATRTLRISDPTEMGRRIRGLAGRDRDRAWELLERGLEHDPRNLELLSTKALLAEDLGQLDQACEALKMLVHLELEKGGAEAARQSLEKLKGLDEKDPFVWEKSFELALAERRTADAFADAHRLVELYRGPGLHKKARVVVERMLSIAGETWDLISQLAQLCAEAGDAKSGVAILEKYGAARLAEEDYARARRVYEEILALDPRNKNATRTLEEIASGELLQKRARWRKIKRRVVIGVCTAIFVPCFFYEVFARHAYLTATRGILRENLIEDGHYADAAERYRAVQTSWRWSSTALYELPRTIAELEAKQRAAATVEVAK
jgi:tetratricopeptide (TPR) repeat protein